MNTVFNQNNVNDCLNKIFNLYQKYGSKDYIGEEMTQTEHMVQGAMFAENNGESLDVVLSIFLHDIGHLLELELADELKDKSNNQRTMGDFGAMNHETKGRIFLENLGIPYPIPQLVENHVVTKRYLVCINKNYYNNLSEASKKTLEYQGGPMSAEEALLFERNPLFAKSLKVREYDEKSKLKNLKLKPLEYYRDLLKRYLIGDY